MDPVVPFIEVALHANDVVADRFRLVRELGRGAMGAVWLAHHEALDVPCAVKFIAGSGATVRELRMRFEREARAAAQIRSPHVVQILDHGIWLDHPYIAMEYLEGEDLQCRLDRDGVLSSEATVDLITQMARGLTKAHASGIIHRDLKPENVFLVQEQDGFLVKILDFGIAKKPALADDSHAKTRTGALLGTPYYMSPEQADGTKPVDARSDLWSVGVITYRSIVGLLPFDSQAVGDLLMRIMDRPIPVPSEVNGEVPAGFDAWWARAACRDPNGRFQTAKELADALADALAVTRESATPGVALAASSPSLAAGAPAQTLVSGPPPPGTTVDMRPKLSATSASGPGLGALSATNAPEVIPERRQRRGLVYGGLGLLAAVAVGGVALLAQRGSVNPTGFAAAAQEQGVEVLPPASESPPKSAPAASAEPAPAASTAHPIAQPPPSAIPAKPAIAGSKPSPVRAKPAPRSPSSSPAEPAPPPKPDMGF